MTIITWFKKKIKMQKYKRDWRLKERWEDYPSVNYDKSHIYCQIAFDNSGKTFYYRTRNPKLRVRDFVYVPVGYDYSKKVGQIVTIKKYAGNKVPYPIEKTKYIIGLAEREFKE